MRNDKWKSNLDPDWNNPDFEYYLLDTNILYDFLSGDDIGLVWLKSRVSSTRYRLLLLDRITLELYNSVVKFNRTKVKNIRQTLNKYGKVVYIENQQIQSAVNWAKEEYRSGKYVNNKGTPLSEVGLLILKCVLNHSNIIAVTRNTYLHDEIIERGRSAQVLNPRLD